MFESQGTTPAEQDSTPSVTIMQLQSQLQHLQASHDNYKRLYLDASNTISEAREVIQDVLAGDIDAQATYEAFRDAFEGLGVSMTRLVNIDLSITWRGTIALPHGIDVSDLDIDDFRVSIDGHREYEAEFNSWHEDASIEEL